MFQAGLKITKKTMIISIIVGISFINLKNFELLVFLSEAKSFKHLDKKP
jgi:hypothetical protein